MKLGIGWRWAICAGALAGGNLWALDGELTAKIGGREIPIERAEPVAHPILEGDQYQLSLRIDPTQQSTYDGLTRQDLFGQNFALAYQMKLTSTLDATYEIVAGAMRGDLWLLASDASQSHDTFGISHKAGVAWQASKVFVLHLFAMGGSTMHPDTGSADTTVQAGGDVVWTLWKDGKISAQGSVGETTPFQKSILAQEKVGLTFEQKLPWAPLTLQTASTLAAQHARQVSPDDSTSLKLSAALQWAVRPDLLLWSVGVDDQQTDFRLDEGQETLRSYYTQYTLTPDAVWNFTMRTSYDAHEKTGAPVSMADHSVNLTLGVNVKMGDRFGAGVLLRYRLPDRAQPASTSGTPGETMLSISATSLF